MSEYVRARVSDGDSGTAPENLGELFDPLFTTLEIGVDSGLCLAVAKRIVESYGGTVDCGLQATASRQGAHHR